MDNNENSIFLEKIKKTNDVQKDTLWGILKYQELGIFRKLKCMALVLGIDFDKDVLPNVPVDEDGRVLDHKTRYLIHDVLIKVSRKADV